MQRHLLIWGAGGHAKVVLDIALCCGIFDSVSFVDDNFERIGSTFCGFPVLGGPDMLKRHVSDPFLVAIGSNQRRRQCFECALGYGLTPVTLVHPTAVIARSVNVGKGTVVMPGVIVNSEASVGDNCILNTGAIIEHECRVGHDVHISPRAVLGGRVIVDDLAHVGIGAVVLPGAFVGFEAIVGGGAVVLKEAPSHCTVVGVPAKALVFK